MDYITIQEAAEKWGLKERCLQVMCQEEKIPGVRRFGHSWAIPADTEWLADGRVKSGKISKRRAMLTMTDVQ